MPRSCISISMWRRRVPRVWLVCLALVSSGLAQALWRYLGNERVTQLPLAEPPRELAWQTKVKRSPRTHVLG